MSLAEKLPYYHTFAQGFPGIGSQRVPVDSDVLSFASASGAIQIVDLVKLENLVAYLKSQSLWDYARFYPMKSSQNAGSGSTVYGLGGLTSNNMTLVNSPTWGSDGVTFDGSTQYGNVGDIFNGGDLTLFSRVSFASATASAYEGVAGSYRGDLNKRSFVLYRAGAAAGDPFEMRRSSNGSGAIEYYHFTDSVPSSEDECVVSEWLASDSRSLWQNKTQRAGVIVFGSTPQTSTYDSDQDVFFAAVNGSATPTDYAALVGHCFLALTGESTTLTTTQRETITDLVNAL